jgi:hypothetical protein
VVAALAIATTAAVLLLPSVGVALLTRRRAGWEAIAAVAAGVATAAGYSLLDATVKAVFPGVGVLASLGERAGAAALRLGVLVPYALLAAWLAPRLAGTPRRSLRRWLGLIRFDGSTGPSGRASGRGLAEVLPTLLLALAAAALVTLPWPVTGALGDSLTSLSLAFETLAWAIPQTLIFWGVVFCLLTSTFVQPWTAALATILLYGLSTLGGVLPAADWGALGDGIFLLPLALLLTELRAREGGVYPLLPVAFWALAAPLLFVDPRDALAQGIPEPQHILSHTVAMVSTAVLGLALWIGRRILLALQDRAVVPAWARLTTAASAMVVLWGLWGGLYVFAGQLGFSNDGFLIMLEEQADLSPARAIPDRESRLQYVYETLVETAERTQAPVRAELDALGVPYRPYYVINMIRVDGRRWLMRRFEDWPGVAQVLLNPNVREYPRRIPLPYGGDDAPVEGVQPNLAAIHADGAWALGVMGQGIVVAGQDTGYDWTHPALQPHYRGWDGQRADHDTNWHDAWDDGAVPFDGQPHRGRAGCAMDRLSQHAARLRKSGGLRRVHGVLPRPISARRRSLHRRGRASGPPRGQQLLGLPRLRGLFPRHAGARGRGAAGGGDHDGRQRGQRRAGLWHGEHAPSQLRRRLLRRRGR